MGPRGLCARHFGSSWFLKGRQWHFRGVYSLRRAPPPVRRPRSFRLLCSSCGCSGLLRGRHRSAAQSVPGGDLRVLAVRGRVARTPVLSSSGQRYSSLVVADGQRRRGTLAHVPRPDSDLSRFEMEHVKAVRLAPLWTHCTSNSLARIGRPLTSIAACWARYSAQQVDAYLCRTRPRS